MSLLILTAGLESYFNKRLHEEAEKTGVHIRIAYPQNLILAHNGVLLNGNPISDIGSCLMRTPPYREEKDFLHMAGRLLEKQGIKVINSPAAVEIAGNKFRTSVRLAGAGVPVLPSFCLRKNEDIDPIVENLGGYPVFLKTLFGTRGIGVIFCQCRETLLAAAQTLWAYGANLFVERWARKASAGTLRILVFKGIVIASVHNSIDNDSLGSHNPAGSVRANFCRGGSMKAFDPPPDMIKLALDACHVCGMDFAGVDLIEDEDRWKVLEINSSPGIRGIEKATGENIAGSILAMI